MAKKPRRPRPLMLYDGTADAIKSIRLRKYGPPTDRDKRFTQTACAKRAGERFTLRKWNEIETGKQRCLREDLEGVLRGLMCTEADLRGKKLQLERLNHVAQHAAEIGEDSPTYGTSQGGLEVNDLYDLPLEELPAVLRDLFNFTRNLVAARYSIDINAADQVKIMFENYKKQAEEAKAKDTEEPEDPEDTEDSEEE